MAYLRRSTLRGVYSPLNFPLPSNSLPMLPGAVAAVKAAANIAVKQNGGGAGMAGAYGPPARRWPGAYSRRGMAVLSGARRGMGQATFDPISWVKENPLTTAGIVIGAVVLLGMGGRKRR